MEILVTHLKRKPSGDAARRVSEISDDVIRIGRGADCHVHLPDPRVPLVHSEIHKQDGASYISKLQTLSDLAVNGKATRSARLNIGDRLDIGPYELFVTDCPENKELCLTVELTRPFGDDFVGLNQRSVTELTSLGFGKTTWSILATVVTLVVCLGLPLAAALMPAQQDGLAMEAGRRSPDTGAAAAEPRLALLLAAWISSADSLWISGGISNAHRYFADNCGVCHQKPFVQVKDAACLQCHEGIQQHADANKFASASFESFSCQSCHKEHDGLDPIVLDEQAFCSSCHVRLRAMEPETRVLDVGDFGVAHPEFRPTVMTDPTVPTKVRISLADAPKLKEMSNLKFPHDKHLRRLGDAGGTEPGGIQHPQKGRIELSCQDCHEPEPGGAGMLPIKMEKNCEACHGLEFDPNAKHRRLTHGKPREAVEQMREFYAMMALQGGLQDPTAPRVVRVRRMPGKTLSPEEMATSLRWANEKAAAVAKETIGKRACGKCHFVTPPDVGSADGIWHVMPVNLVDRWMPKGRFVHRDHQQEACESCHAAGTSKRAEDVMLPSIERCRGCHSGEESTGKVVSVCITCHRFHQPDMGPMKASNTGRITETKSGS